MKWHIIEGEAGCEFAVAHKLTAIVVDALRASATAAMLCEAGASPLLAVRDVDEARQAKREMPDALLFGERGGLPPDGFDYGNSPREAHHAKGRPVVFTTTTGAGRLISAWGAGAVLMGTTVNASATAAVAAELGRDVVLIPAGLADDADFDAQEDRCAAVAIAMKAGVEIGEGQDVFELWRDRIDAEGFGPLFERSPHAEKLRQIGLGDDVAWCAQVNVTKKVPQAVTRTELGVILNAL